MNIPSAKDRIVWKASSSMVGPITVLRPFPNPAVQSIGPFVFLDHFGPVAAPEGKLPAHPHAGIEVMTYLMDGANEHTDSQGNLGQIGPGGAQWMKAGRGILHAERNLVDRATTMHGLQIWARLPIADQDGQPDYRAFQSEDMPEWGRDGARFRLLAGSFEGRQGPIPLALPSIMVHISLADETPLQIDLPNADHEYGLYVIAGACVFEDDGPEELAQGMMVRLAGGAASLQLRSRKATNTDVFLLGGHAAPQPLYFGGPFVLDSPQALAEAERRYMAGEMGTLDGVPF